MVEPLRVLLLEDRDADARLVLAALRRAGYDAECERVQTEDEYASRLRPELDVILADFSMPGFDALRALEILRARALDVPFIVVSGSIGEDSAVHAMRLGATDYLLKDRLGRIGQAVARALEARRLRAERRHVDEQLSLQASALTAAANGILITDRDGAILWANPAFSAITGYAFDDIQGRNPRFLKSGRHDARFYEQLWKTILEGRVWKGEIVNRRKDGTLFFSQQIITPVRDASGAIAHFVAINDDVTDRRRLEEQFRQAQKMEAVGRIAGGVAHDFNNILTVIGGFCDVLLETRHCADPAYSDLMEIKKASERAAALTRQLLAFSRRQALSVRVVDLNALVPEMQKMLERVLGEDVELCLLLCDRLGRIEVDAGQVEQVVLNLAVNSRDAMPRGGRLVIETRNVTLDPAAAQSHFDATPGEYVALVVTDTGIGMDEATRSHLFEPFFTTKTAGKGTGLGLATVYGVMKQSRGFINVYSEPGRGTAFKAHFPRVDKALTSEATAIGPAARVDGSETILLAEDEETLRNLAERVLARHGYRVLAARDGAEAVEVASRHTGPIDLVVTDVVMPRMGGREVAQRVAAQFPKAKVLYISGYTDDTMVLNGVVDAQVPFLQKPFSPDALARKVRAVLDGGDVPG